MKVFKSPASVNFEITHECNAKCKFCSIRSREHQKFAKLEDLIFLVDAFKKNNVMRINFFGGEPFIYPQIVPLMKHAKDQGFFVSAITNGLNLDEELCLKIKDYVDVVGVSLHGDRETHENLIGIPGSYDSTIAAIASLEKYNIPTGINMTVTGDNYKQITQVAKIKDEIDVQFIALNRFIPEPSTNLADNKIQALSSTQLEETLRDVKCLKEKYPKVSIGYSIHFPFCVIKDSSLHEYIGKGCGFGASYCAIDYAGNMKMCSYSDAILGNLFCEDMAEIWRSNSLLNEFRCECWMPEKCQKCEHRVTCCGGCKITRKKAFAPDIMLDWRLDNAKIYKLHVNKTITQEDENEFLVMSNRGLILKLNRIGKEILELCKGSGKTKSEICQELTQKYSSASQAAIDSDVSKFLAQIEKCDMFEGEAI